MSSSSNKSSFWFGPPLVDESACGDFVAVSRFLRAGHDVNETNQLGASALLVAAQYNHLEVVRTLLRNKQIDVNLQDDSGETALMKAASEGHTEILKTLCKRRDIDLNIQDSTGWTALMHARGKLGIVKILLQQRSMDMTRRDDSDCNAFHRACNKGWTNVVKAILRSKRALNQLTKEDFEYAEHLAKDHGYVAVTKMIMQAASAQCKKITT